MGAGNSKKVMIPQDISIEQDHSTSKVRRNGYFNVHEKGFQVEVITFKDNKETKPTEKSLIIINEEEKKEDCIGTF